MEKLDGIKLITKKKLWPIIETENYQLENEANFLAVKSSRKLEAKQLHLWHKTLDQEKLLCTVHNDTLVNTEINKTSYPWISNTVYIDMHDFTLGCISHYTADCQCTVPHVHACRCLNVQCYMCFSCFNKKKLM